MKSSPKSLPNSSQIKSSSPKRITESPKLKLNHHPLKITQTQVQVPYFLTTWSDSVGETVDLASAGGCAPLKAARRPLVQRKA